MKRGLAAIVLICLGAGVAWYLISSKAPDNSSSLPPLAKPAGQPAASQPAIAGKDQAVPPNATESPETSPSTLANTTPSATTFARTPAPPPTAPDPSGLPPATVLENMRTTIRQYGSMFDGNPVGTNLEITRALDGENPKQAKFLRPEAGMRTNQKGELVDPWGTPYFFHQLSGHEMEIRSAGPDRIMWTADDLVIK
jgi:hypothetical protein